MAVTSEHELALAVAALAAKNGDKASYSLIYAELPKMVQLTDEDFEPLKNRNGEHKWRQRVRNIKSHYEVPGNALERGFLIHKPDWGFELGSADDDIEEPQL